MKTLRQPKIVEPPRWTVVGFLDEFMKINETVNDRSFAFILGAGASVTSGIPDATKLVRDWIQELYRRQVGESDKIALEEWAIPQNLGIPGFRFDHAATFYPQVYEKRFGDDPELGYAALEDAMQNAEPNIGYSILAKVIAETRHKIIITTNFDNLVADALSIYTDIFPLICGHESLTGFVRPRLRRPLIAKIHRDLLFAPKSDAEGTSRLDPGWSKALRTLFREYTPLVLGYGGNDGSLMDFLEELKPGEIQGGIYWFYRLSDGLPNTRICELIVNHRGKVVPIPGFDEFMLLLGERFKYPPLSAEVERRAEERVQRYRNQFEKFSKSLKPVPKPEASAEEFHADQNVRKALTLTVERDETWWSWEQRARNAEKRAEQEAIYREGLRHFPNSSNLTANFANFLRQNRKDYDEAERLYRRALELDPKNAWNVGSFANFLSQNRKDYDEAERLYRRALELDPEDARNTGNFAGFLLAAGRYDEAMKMTYQAWSLPYGLYPQVSAEILLYWCLLRRVFGNEDSEGLARLKYLFNEGYVRYPWNFEGMLGAVKSRITSEEMTFYSTLAAAILDETKVKELNQFDKWKKLKPAAITSAWDME